MKEQPVFHQPVLVKEVLDILAPAPGKLIVDATLGHGGHALAILSRIGTEGLLVGIDRDPQMLATARKRFEAANVARSRYRLVEADHADLADILANVLAPAQVPAPDALLFDLGPSTIQLLDPARGMSWDSDQSLDMRMRATADYRTGEEIVNTWDTAGLAQLFRDNADERWAKRIARAIVEARAAAPIRTGQQLGRIVAQAIPRKAWPPRIHPATRVFLALRIEVNNEYRTLEEVLPTAFDLLKPSGRMAVICFHSGEDRRVKTFMREIAQPPTTPWPLPQGKAGPARARLLTRRPIGPGAEEQAANPNSRSARLRALEKRAPDPSDSR